MQSDALRHSVAVEEIKLTAVLREIFGPVLPIVPVSGIDEAIEFINARSVWAVHPSALCSLRQWLGSTHWLFMCSRETRRSKPKVARHSSSQQDLCGNTVLVFDNTQSGTAVANEVMIHMRGVFDCAVLAIANPPFCAVHGLPFGGIGPSGGARLP